MKPTIFRNNTELLEAIDAGYLETVTPPQYPTVIWKEGTSIVFQSNADEAWSCKAYTTTIRKSVEWSDIRHDYMPKSTSFMAFLEEHNVKSNYLKNCITCNQRWHRADEYYDDIADVCSKEPDNWLLGAFHWNNQGDGINWGMLHDEWMKLPNPKVWE